MSSKPTSDIFLRLEKTGAKKVALQFPEGLKRKACSFATDLRERGYEVIISGEPCWGACDLDLDLLKDADILIHYGHAPVDSREDVLYEYLRRDIDIEALEEVLPHLTKKEVGLVTTIQHVHQLPEIKEFLKNTA